jgi:hypothetical protein
MKLTGAAILVSRGMKVLQAAPAAYPFRSAAVATMRMTGYEKQFPTRGDLAREQLRRRGIPYFSDVQGDIEHRLGQLPSEARKAFALACAERLMRWHEHLPREEQRAFTLGWRLVLDVMWTGLQGHSEEPQRRVHEALEAFHARPYDHDEGPGGPDDADEDAAAASIYAGECYVKGDAQLAAESASRAVAAAFCIAVEELQLDPNDFVWDPPAEPMPLAKENMHPAVQGELKRQLRDLELLERDGVNGNVLKKLRQ